MAQLNIAANKASDRKKLRTPFVDMTPLVDLGFLLITFFIFTSSMAEPMGTPLHMPADGPSTQLKETASLTVLLDKDNRIYYYEGQWSNVLENGLSATHYHIVKGLGHVIRQKQKALGSRKAELMLLIKPLEETTYANMINVLDEVQINGLKKFAMIEPSEEEKAFVQQKSGS